jgi:pimeloyl-ACP methyl ester carboxylesterase
MPYLDLPIASLHYTEHGAGNALVLLHANPGDSRDFDAVIYELAKHFRVIAIDWPGYGQSDPLSQPEAASVPLLYQLFCQFVQALQLDKMILLGNSVGGNICARYAAEHPAHVQGLVLVSPGGFTPHNIFTRAFCRLQASAFSIPPSCFARLYLKQHTSVTQAVLERAKNEQSLPHAKSFNRALWRSFGKSESDVRDLASTISAPTLLLFGQYDPAVPARSDGKTAASCIPHAEMRVLPCGHASFAELPEVFLSELFDFFNRHQISK